MKSIFPEDLSARDSWQQDTPTKSDIVVSFYHSTQCSPEQACVAEYLSALQQLALSACCALSINIRQNVGGQVVTTVHTKLSTDAVCVSIAEVKQQYSASTGVAVVVRLQGRTIISAATSLPWNSRA